jgi:hypothetical protein
MPALCRWVDCLFNLRALPLQALAFLVLPLPWVVPRLLAIQLAVPAAAMEGAAQLGVRTGGHQGAAGAALSLCRGSGGRADAVHTAFLTCVHQRQAVCPRSSSLTAERWPPVMRHSTRGPSLQLLLLPFCTVQAWQGKQP